MPIKLLLCATFLVTVIFSSCSKSNEKDATTKPQYDNSNYGVYKGVFVGSSGIIVLDINNSGSILAMLKVDGTVYNFITSQTIQQNQVTTIVFTSTNGNSFTFNVGANGDNPVITNLVINGHPTASILVVKETSTEIVKCYEGTYNGGASGTVNSGIFNAVIYNNQIKGLVRNVVNIGEEIAIGTVLNNQINCKGTVSGGSEFVGILSGDNIYGTWTFGSANGEWSGIRTY